MSTKGEIVRGKVQWRTREGTLGVILDQQGRQIYYTEENVVSMLSGKKLIPDEDETVDVLIDAERQATHGVLQAKKVVPLGKLD
ncbi:MAG: hypothetical protein JW918_05730 [Anaerolineae bacterium]|nr:hypothetical protein [Anaerolineae bacterium]